MLDVDHLEDISCRDEEPPLARKRRVRPKISSQPRGDGEEGALGGIVRDEGVKGAHIRGGGGEAPKHNRLAQLRPVDGLQIKRDSSPENTGSRAKNLSHFGVRTCLDREPILLQLLLVIMLNTHSVGKTRTWNEHLAQGCAEELDIREEGQGL